MLYKEGSYTAAQAQSLARAETRCSGSTVPTPTPTPTPEPTPTPPAVAPSIASVQYINSDTENVLGNLTNGTQINLSSINNSELTFRATTNPTIIGSVRFQLTGPRNFTKIDNGAPYSLVGENGSNYYGLALPVGNYSLKLSPYSGSNASGTKGNDVTITFSVVNGTSTPTPTPTPTSSNFSFVLVNSTTNQDISSLTTGGNITNGNNINIRAVSSFSNTASVYFVVQGPTSRTFTENVAPYALFGDINGNYSAGSLANGSYSLTTTAYTGSNRTGTNLGSTTINFTVGTGASTPTPTPTPPPTGSSLITSFQLYNANTDQPISTLSNGGQIAPSSTPLTIVANTASSVSLVRFQLTGPVNETRNEGSAPFSLFGDIGVDLLGKILPVGSYTLRATPTTSSGTGATVTINFTVGTSATTSAKVAAFAYPNPIEDSKLSVKLPQKEYGTVNYSLKSSSGVEVETGQAQVIASDDQADVNLSSFDRIVPGVYYLTVHSLNGTYTIPIIKK